MSADSLINIKTPEEIKVMREAGAILASIVRELKCSLKSGVATREIDQKAEKLIAERHVLPAFKGYREFPACVCLSINEEVVHGIPGDRVLKDGDIASLDMGVIYKGYYSDMAVTVGIGTVRKELQNLMDVTKRSLAVGIEQACEGKHLSDISHAIQRYAEMNKFSVVREFVGHGIGRLLHEEPEIPNFGPPNRGPLLKEGMVFAIEPMVNLGKSPTKILDDGWTVKTEDGQPSAHFEHTIAIRKNGPEVLTQ